MDLGDLSPRDAEAVTALMAATEVLCRSADDEDGHGPDGGRDGRQAAAIAGVLAAGISRLTAAKVALLPVIEADGLWAVDGARSFAQWVARRQDLGVQTARVQAKMGRTLRDHLPLTAGAVAAGRITVEHAQVLAQLAPTTDQRRRLLADPDSEVGEAFLVDQAGRMGVDDLRTLVRRWAAYTDPDADDRGYIEACDREHLEITRLYDMYDVHGQLTVAHGQALKAALRAITPVPAAGDERTATQRRAQALADLAKVTLDREGAGAGRTVRPRINVLVDHPTFVGLLTSARRAHGAHRTHGAQHTLDGDGATVGPVRSPSFATAAMLTGQAIAGGPQYEDGTPVSRTDLDLLACDCGIARVIFGPRSEVLDVGRTERTFTGPRRAALIARDKHCRYPGCTAPPVLCDGHHLDHWARDHGNTAVHRGILLCTFHHGHVHRRRIEIAPRGEQFRFTDRHGREITPDGGRGSPVVRRGGVADGG